MHVRQPRTEGLCGYLSSLRVYCPAGPTDNSNDQLHVKGAINLSFPDIAIENLRKAIPDKKTRILIYCNNNFLNAQGPFPSKLPSASLNLSTYIALYNYGYRNLFELADTLDIKESKLQFEPGFKRP